MKNLAKNTVYVVVIHTGSDPYNRYSKVVNAYKITNAKRTYLSLSGERIELRSNDTQITKEYLERIGFNVPTYLPQNVIVTEHELKSYRELKKQNS